MILALLISITAIIGVFAVLFTVLFFVKNYIQKDDFSFSALTVVFWIAEAFSGIVLLLFCLESNEMTLSDILSFYGTMASVLASAYLGYVVYKIQKDEVCQHHSCCCIMNKIEPSRKQTEEETTMEVRWVSNDHTPDYYAEAGSGSLDDIIFPQQLKGTLAIIGRGTAKLQTDFSMLEKIKERMGDHPSGKQPPVMLFSLENHGPAFLQEVEFSFGDEKIFRTSLIMASTPDHKCKWCFLPEDVFDEKLVFVTFISCYGNKTYADFKLTDLFPKTFPGVFFSCKHYHYRGSQKSRFHQ